MFKTIASVIALAGLSGFAVSTVQALPVNKCVINGTVSYQSDPCPSQLPRKPPPTLQALNAQEKKRRESSLAPAPASAPAGPEAAAPASPSGLRCDGRQYCSQMRSCAEAKYFLANCPGVQMDGDRNGIPCEKQWCHL